MTRRIQPVNRPAGRQAAEVEAGGAGAVRPVAATTRAAGEAQAEYGRQNERRSAIGLRLGSGWPAG
jgi:hypothetical protein